MKRFFALFFVMFLVLATQVTVFAGEGFELSANGAKSLDSAIAKMETYTNPKDGTSFKLIKRGNGTNRFEVDSVNFSSLSSKDKNKALKDSLKLVKDSAMTEQDKQFVYTAVQAEDGTASAVISMLMSDTKPNFIRAMEIFGPFNSPLGIILGLASIILSAFLVITMMCDISYMTIPLLRGSGSNAQGGMAKPSWVSHEAYSSVLEAEGGAVGGAQSGSGSKQLLGIYLKKRIIMLILFGICLLYLIQGKIFDFVGWILDLASGF